MAERRKNKKRKEIETKELNKKEPSKEEYEVAQYLKKHLPEKKTTLQGHKVEYFIASKAVDCLVASHWAEKNKKGEMNFSNRDVVVDFMEKMLLHKFFHRARKIVVEKKEPKKKKKNDDDSSQESSKKKKKDEDSGQESSKIKKESSKKEEVEEEKEQEEEKKEEEEVEVSTKSKKKKKKGEEKEVESGKSSKKKDGKEKEKNKDEGVKKKIKLDMHMEQIFVDSNAPYVWIYDPIPLKTWITGTLFVVAAVLLCLFPLWPQVIRHYIYYLSVAAAFFLVFIIGLVVLRFIVFILVWTFSMGKHHLWLLPNLTEDVGFLESFWPLYQYEYKGDVKKEEEGEEKEKEGEENEKEGEENEKEENEQEQESNDEEQKSDQDSDDTPATENGFEFLDPEEVAEEEEEEEERKTK